MSQIFKRLFSRVRGKQKGAVATAAVQSQVLLPVVATPVDFGIGFCTIAWVQTSQAMWRPLPHRRSL